MLHVELAANQLLLIAPRRTRWRRRRSGCAATCSARRCARGTTTSSRRSPRRCRRIWRARSAAGARRAGDEHVLRTSVTAEHLETLRGAASTSCRRRRRSRAAIRGWRARRRRRRRRRDRRSARTPSRRPRGRQARPRTAAFDLVRFHANRASSEATSASAAPSRHDCRERRRDRDAAPGRRGAQQPSRRARGGACPRHGAEIWLGEGDDPRGRRAPRRGAAGWSRGRPVGTGVPSTQSDTPTPYQSAEIVE